MDTSLLIQLIMDFSIAIMGFITCGGTLLIIWTMIEVLFALVKPDEPAFPNKDSTRIFPETGRNSSSRKK